MRRLSILLTGLLALSLFASACASDLDPAVEVGAAELSRDELDDLVAEAAALQADLPAGVVLPIVGVAPSPLASTESASAYEGVINLFVLSELFDVAFEVRGVDPEPENRAQIRTQVEGEFLAAGLDDELDTGIGDRLREFFVDQAVLSQGIGLFTPTDEEVAALAAAVGADDVTDPTFVAQVQSTIANGPIVAAVIFASLTTGVDVDPRFGSWSDFDLAVAPRQGSIGYPPGVTPTPFPG